jgi:dTDP-glucose 4,6-dehydratase
MRILITGGAGFIGSALVRYYMSSGLHDVTVATSRSYAANMRNLETVDPHLHIGDLTFCEFAERLARIAPDIVLHLAAETHVDRAIIEPAMIVYNNMVSTTNLLQAFTHPEARANLQKIILYSTDEVFGPTPAGMKFDESQPFAPSNAYSASKVGCEAIGNAFRVTHGLPIIVVRPCNTYGPAQHPEKFIPRILESIRNNAPITIYNDGEGSRDWLYIDDHVRAIEAIVQRGTIGASYNLAAREECTDNEIVRSILKELQRPHYPTRYVPGRPGHDKRYAMTSGPLDRLRWYPAVRLPEGLRKTVQWHLANPDWWESVEVAMHGSE